MDAFQDLYSGTIYEENKANSDECPQYCMNKEQISRCDALCECAYVREILQIVQEQLDEAKDAHPFPGKLSQDQV